MKSRAALFALALIPTALCCAKENPTQQSDYLKQTAKINEESAEQIKELTGRLQENSQDLQAYSRRGDAYFFGGNYDAAIADYEKMIEIDPTVEVSHWRLGLAYYYAGQYAKTAKQLGKYHDFDDQDRENGIWIFLADAHRLGVKKARESMIHYTKKDRPPLVDVYNMFEGKLTADELLAKIQNEIKEESLNQLAAEQRLFYTYLYIGLFAEAEKNPEQARKAFLEAVKTQWPQKVGGGPGYMWHCARLRLLALDEAAKSKKKE